MTALTCPICRAPATGGQAIGDSTVFICPNCGGYRLSGTVTALLRLRTVEPMDPGTFRNLVARKRGRSPDYLLITAGDLGG